MFTNNPAAGSLAIVRGANTLTLPGSWCAVKSLGPLWVPGGPRGSDLVLPGVDGELARPHQRGAVQYRLRLILANDVLYNGSTPASLIAGLQQNVAWLQTFCEPIATAPYTLAATLTRTASSVLTGGVRLSLVLDEDGLQSSHGRCSLIGDVPAGRLA